MLLFLPLIIGTAFLVARSLHAERSSSPLEPRIAFVEKRIQREALRQNTTERVISSVYLKVHGSEASSAGGIALQHIDEAVNSSDSAGMDIY